MSERKLFTAEIQYLKQRGEQAGAAAAGPSASNAEVLKAIEGLRADIRGLEHLIKGEEAPPPAHEDPVAQKGVEVSMLKTELRALAVCIEQTKVEIAALRPKDADEDRLIAVTFELDAIVTATERATQQILEAAEKIEGLSREIASHGTDAYISRVVEDINETIVNIFEACNFQDITGQRITKVVKTLQYIENRVNNMIDIWGAENIAEATPTLTEDHKDDDAKLLNGPQLESKAISQDEIDKLFG